jgi:DNA repair protein RadC
MQPYADREDVEALWIVALNAQHRIIFNRPIVITRGILNSSLVHPREVFRAAIVANAAGIILVHNHPSGDAAPSADDKTVTEQLASAGRVVEIPVHDHVVIGRGSYFSFAEHGLI